MIYGYFTLFLTRITKCILDHAFTLSPNVVVPKKNGKLKICVDFKIECNNEGPFPITKFINEVLNTMARCEAYSFFDGYLRYHHIFIAPKINIRNHFNIIFQGNWTSLTLLLKKNVAILKNGVHYFAHKTNLDMCSFF